MRFASILNYFIFLAIVINLSVTDVKAFPRRKRSESDKENCSSKIEIKAYLMSCDPSKTCNLEKDGGKFLANIPFSEFDRDGPVTLNNVRKCRRKLIISMKFTNIGKTRITEDLITLDSAYNCFSNERTQLLHPLVFKISQEQVVQMYKMKYLHVVNAKAREEVINKNCSNFSGCDDSSANPTCGFAFYKGAKIPYSQGFCCSCNSDESDSEEEGETEEPTRTTCRSSPQAEGGNQEIQFHNYEKAQSNVDNNPKEKSNNMESKEQRHGLHSQKGVINDGRAEIQQSTDTMKTSDNDGDVKQFTRVHESTLAGSLSEYDVTSETQQVSVNVRVDSNENELEILSSQPLDHRSGIEEEEEKQSHTSLQTTNSPTTSDNHIHKRTVDTIEEILKKYDVAKIENDGFVGISYRKSSQNGYYRSKRLANHKIYGLRPWLSSKGKHLQNIPGDETTIQERAMQLGVSAAAYADMLETVKSMLKNDAKQHRRHKRDLENSDDEIPNQRNNILNEKSIENELNSAISEVFRRHGFGSALARGLKDRSKVSDVDFSTRQLAAEVVDTLRFRIGSDGLREIKEWLKSSGVTKRETSLISLQNHFTKHIIPYSNGKFSEAVTSVQDTERPRSNKADNLRKLRSLDFPPYKEFTGWFHLPFISRESSKRLKCDPNGHVCPCSCMYCPLCPKIKRISPSSNTKHPTTQTTICTGENSTTTNRTSVTKNCTTTCKHFRTTLKDHSRRMNSTPSGKYRDDGVLVFSFPCQKAQCTTQRKGAFMSSTSSSTSGSTSSPASTSQSKCTKKYRASTVAIVPKAKQPTKCVTETLCPTCRVNITFRGWLSAFTPTQSSGSKHREEIQTQPTTHPCTTERTTNTEQEVSAVTEVSVTHICTCPECAKRTTEKLGKGSTASTRELGKETSSTGRKGIKCWKNIQPTRKVTEKSTSNEESHSTLNDSRTDEVMTECSCCGKDSRTGQKDAVTEEGKHAKSGNVNQKDLVKLWWNKIIQDTFPSYSKSGENGRMVNRNKSIEIGTSPKVFSEVSLTNDNSLSTTTPDSSYRDLQEKKNNVILAMKLTTPSSTFATYFPAMRQTSTYVAPEELQQEERGSSSDEEMPEEEKTSRLAGMNMNKYQEKDLDNTDEKTNSGLKIAFTVQHGDSESYDTQSTENQERVEFTNRGEDDKGVKIYRFKPLNDGNFLITVFPITERSTDVYPTRSVGHKDPLTTDNEVNEDSFLSPDATLAKIVNQRSDSQTPESSGRKLDFPIGEPSNTDVKKQLMHFIENIDRELGPKTKDTKNNIAVLNPEYHTKSHNSIYQSGYRRGKIMIHKPEDTNEQSRRSTTDIPAGKAMNIQEGKIVNALGIDDSKIIASPVVEIYRNGKLKLARKNKEVVLSAVTPSVFDGMDVTDMHRRHDSSYDRRKHVASLANKNKPIALPNTYNRLRYVDQPQKFKDVLPFRSIYPLREHHPTPSHRKSDEEIAPVISMGSEELNHVRKKRSVESFSLPEQYGSIDRYSFLKGKNIDPAGQSEIGSIDTVSEELAETQDIDSHKRYKRALTHGTVLNQKSKSRCAQKKAIPEVHVLKSCRGSGRMHHLRQSNTSKGEKPTHLKKRHGGITRKQPLEGLLAAAIMEARARRGRSEPSRAPRKSQTQHARRLHDIHHHTHRPLHDRRHRRHPHEHRERQRRTNTGQPAPPSAGSRHSRQVDAEGRQVRGGQECKRRGDGDGEGDAALESAHCLRFSPNWYSVYELAMPKVAHGLTIQVFQRRTSGDDGGHSWAAITSAPIVLDAFSRSARDEGGAFAFTYSSPRRGPSAADAALEPSEQLLLLPQPPAGHAFPQAQGGPGEFLVVPRKGVTLDGSRCDAAGVGYAAFAHQPDRCARRKGACLGGQPLDLWHRDAELKRKGRRGKHFLENFATLPPQALRSRAGSGDTFLALAFERRHQDVVDLELRADANLPVSSGLRVLVEWATSDGTGGDATLLEASVANLGLRARALRLRVAHCRPQGRRHKQEQSGKEVNATHKGKGASGTGAEPRWTGEQSGVVAVAPQHSHVFRLRLPGAAPQHPVECVVEVRAEQGEGAGGGGGGGGAARRVTLALGRRCACAWHCACACVGACADAALRGAACHVLNDAAYRATGAAGDVPVEHDPPRQSRSLVQELTGVWMQFAVFGVVVLLVLLVFGLVKGALGCCCPALGHWGLGMFLDDTRRLPHYYEKSLRHRRVVYDQEGYAVHPDTCQRTVRLHSRATEFGVNTVFFLLFPIAISMALCRRCCTRRAPPGAPASGDDAELPEVNRYARWSERSRGPGGSELARLPPQRDRERRGSARRAAQGSVRASMVYAHRQHGRASGAQGSEVRPYEESDEEEQDTRYVLQQLRRSREALRKSGSKPLPEEEHPLIEGEFSHLS